jgi:hypothetical protein
MHVKPAYLHLPMIVVGVVLNGFSIAPARADSLLGMEGYSAPFYSWTDRMDMIDVRLRRNWLGSNEHATLRIPRGYIFFVAEPQKQQSDTDLPQRVDVTEVSVAILHDRTESYVARLKDLKGQMHSAFPLRDTLRAEVATVRLGYTVPPASQALLKRYESSQYVDRGSFEGLIVTRLGSIGASIDLYSPNNTEEFFVARCFEPTRPSYWCTYEFEVCDHISASAASWTYVCTAVCVMPTSACAI